MKNLDPAKKELVEALGEEWVHDDPAVLTCYFRDTSTIDSPRPHLVVLPASTEDVQKLMIICTKYRLPLVPLATGFNIAGLTLPRAGGVVADLKRMNRILDVDEEAMTFTMQPYVRNAAAQAEVNRYRAFGDVGLRIANPITVGSASYFGNIMSGGMSVNTLQTGLYHEHIAGQTWVLPDGSLMKTRCCSNPNAPHVGGYRGPGPDITGMFYNAEGMFGICTELVMNVFADPPESRFLMLRPRDLKKDALPDIIRFYYEVSHLDFCDELYKSSGITLANIMGLVAEEVVPGLPDHLATALITGNDEEELDIKQGKLEEVMKRNGLRYSEDWQFEIMCEALGKTPEEFKANIFRKAYMLAGIMRWKGCFYFLGSATSLDRVVELNEEFEKLIAEHFEPEKTPENTLANRAGSMRQLFQKYIDRLLLRMSVREALKKIALEDLPRMVRDPDLMIAGLSKKKWEKPLYRAHTAIQGPMPLGRGIWLELDMWYHHGDPEDRERIRKFTEACADLMIERSMFIPRDFANAFARQFPRLGTYREVVKDLKAVMDPHGILNPKVLELG